MPKNFKRFKPADKLTLLFLQTFTFSLYNARLKLKNDKFRYSDVLTILIIGELNCTGCKVKDFGNVLGYQNSVARKALGRAAKRKVIYKCGGSRGRGNAAKYFLSDSGTRIYQVLQREMGKTLNEAKQIFTQEAYKSIIRERLT